jgi:hypothetical protein
MSLSSAVSHLVFTSSTTAIQTLLVVHGHEQLLYSTLAPAHVNQGLGMRAHRNHGLRGLPQRIGIDQE